MKIYTRTGDDGETGLTGGGRAAKTDPRIVAYGELDELNAALGMARAAGLPAGTDTLVDRLQHQLFDLGAELLSPQSAAGVATLVSAADVAELETAIDRYEAGLRPLTNFILPGGSAGAAALHFARCACRRAERAIVAAGDTAAIRPVVLQYINRLSDLLFVLARETNQAAGVADVGWRKGDAGASTAHNPPA